jgi:integrase
MPSSKPYQLTWIPAHMRQYFGGVAYLKEYLSGVPSERVKKAKEAAKVRHAALITKIKTLPDFAKARIIAEGGDVRKIGHKVAELKGWQALAPSTADMATGSVAMLSGRDLDIKASLQALEALPRDASRDACLAALVRTAEPREATTAERFAVIQYGEQLRADLATLEPVALIAEPAAAYSFAGLFSRWSGTRVKASSARNYKRTADRLASCFGNVDVRKLRRPDARRFKDWLQENVNGTASQKADIGHAFTLFDTLDNHDLPDGNPFADAKKLRREVGHVTKTKGAFSPVQLRKLIKVAGVHRFGDTRQRKDHESVLWILKVLCYAGSRISETAGLKTADVRRDGAIAYLHFRREAVKAKADEDKSRKVPLHSHIAEGFEAFAKSSKTGFVFGDGDLADWIISYFPRFLRDHAAEIGLDLVDGFNPKTGAPRKVPVDADGQELTLHRIRASFQNTAEAAGVGEKELDDIVGHDGKTVRDKHYRKRLPVAVLAAAIERIKPLGGAVSRAA